MELKTQMNADSKTKLSEKQLHILQHSLGLDQHGQGSMYRNHFVTGLDSKDGADCRELCRLRLMRDHGASQMCGGMHTFTVTELGIGVVKDQSPAPPKVSAGRKRYLEFLESDSGMPFIEWLKRRKASPYGSVSTSI